MRLCLFLKGTAMNIQTITSVLTRCCVASVALIALSTAPLAWAKNNSEGSKTMASGAALSAASVQLLSVEGKPLEASVVTALAGGVVVAGMVQSVGDVVTLSVTGLADGSKYLLKTSLSAVRAAGVSVGTTIRVSAEATGHALIASGKVLAFIPNEVGRALVHQSRM
jgi:hypothetical protein